MDFLSMKNFWEILDAITEIIHGRISKENPKGFLGENPRNYSYRNALQIVGEFLKDS